MLNFDNRDWQEVEIPEDTQIGGGGTVGSFNRLKVKLLRPDEVIAARGRVERSHIILPTAKGYHHLDGKEYTVTQKKNVVMLIRVEDCGLGSAKANAFIQMLGFKV